MGRRRLILSKTSVDGSVRGVKRRMSTATTIDLIAEAQVTEKRASRPKADEVKA